MTLVARMAGSLAVLIVVALATACGAEDEKPAASKAQDAGGDVVSVDVAPGDRDVGLDASRLDDAGAGDDLRVEVIAALTSGRQLLANSVAAGDSRLITTISHSEDAQFTWLADSLRTLDGSNTTSQVGVHSGRGVDYTATLGTRCRAVVAGRERETLVLMRADCVPALSEEPDASSLIYALRFDGRGELTASQKIVQGATEVGTAVASNDGWFIGGSVFGSAIFDDGSIVDGSQAAQTRRGFVAKLTGDLQVEWVEAIGGDAASHVGRIIPEDGGFAALGDFGFESGRSARFGDEPATELMSVSSDDDPGFDIFVAAWDDQRRLRFARRIQNISVMPRHYPWFIRTPTHYGIAIPDGSPPVVRDGEILTSYPLLSSEERQEEGSLALWLEHNGTFAEGYLTPWAGEVSFDAEPGSPYRAVQIITGESPHLERFGFSLGGDESALLVTEHSRPGLNVTADLVPLSATPTPAGYKEFELCGSRQNAAGQLMVCLIAKASSITLPTGEESVTITAPEDAVSPYILMWLAL